MSKLVAPPMPKGEKMTPKRANADTQERKPKVAEVQDAQATKIVKRALRKLLYCSKRYASRLPGSSVMAKVLALSLMVTLIHYKPER